MEKLAFNVLKVTPKEENLAPGHRACIGCGEVLALRLVCKALGDRAIVVNATGCMQIISSQMPGTSWKIPWIHTLFENIAAVASGIEAGIKVMKRKGRGPARDDIKVVAIGGDGATSDIGLQALSGALERGHDFLYVCLDNEAYMNTGIQRSSATPFGASTTTSPAGKFSSGQVTWKKNMPAIVAAHNIPYVATASPSYPIDLMNKVRKGLDTPGPAYVHIYSVCPVGWRTATDLAIKLGRLAVQTGIFPLFEVENGRYKMTRELSELKPVGEYLKLQGRFRHLSEDTIATIQERVQKEYHDLVAKAKQSL